MNKNIIQFIVDENGQYISIPVGRVKAKSNLTTRIQLVTPITSSVAVNYLIYDSKNIEKKQYLIKTGDLGSAVVDPSNPNYQLVAGWKVYEADIYAPILSVISKYRTGKVGMSFEFVEQVPNALCTNFIDYFGFTKELPETASDGDYYICEDYNFWIGENLYNKGDILVWYGEEWHNGGILPKGLTETADISVDPAISYPSEEVDETAVGNAIGEIAEDVAGLDTRLNGVEADLNDKQDKVDPLLETTDKTVVGAINELNSGVDIAINTADTAKDIAEGIDGKATSALNTSATALDTANEAKSIAENAESVALGIDAKASEALENSDEAKAIALSKTNNKSFDTYAEMIAYISDVDNKEKHTVGSEFFIAEDYYSEYWVKEVLTTPNESGYYYVLQQSESTVWKVNGQTGEVVLKTDDISDENETNKWSTSEEKEKVSKIVINGDGTKALLNDGSYGEVGTIDTVSINGGEPILPGENKNIDITITADNIPDTSTTNKFATAEELAQIATNTGDITDLQNNKADKSTTLAGYGITDGALLSETGYSIDLTYTALTGVLGLELKNKTGTTLSSDSVDLPMELIITSGTVETCTVDDEPVVGYVVGDKYIDLVLANGEHIYILASDFIDQITITETGTGNAVTDISINGSVLTEKKDKTFVETSRTVAGKALTENITFASSDLTDSANLIKGATIYGGTIVDNLDTINKSGFYTFYSTAVGSPFTSSGFMQHENSNVGTVSAKQTATAYNSSEIIIYTRVKTNSTWGAWVKITTEKDTQTYTTTLPTTSSGASDWQAVTGGYELAKTISGLTVYDSIVSVADDDTIWTDNELNATITTDTLTFFVSSLPSAEVELTLTITKSINGGTL